MIIVSIARQMLYHRRRSGVWRAYPVSTAAKGTGNIEGSFQTPLGKHRIYAKIGGNEPLRTVFKAREPVGIYDAELDDPKKDWILTRVLWLEGTQTGRNKRGQVDTRRRYIYIHGTHDEEAIGSPASHGCIRMCNDDVLELFDQAFEGETVYIRP